MNSIEQTYNNQLALRERDQPGDLALKKGGKTYQHQLTLKTITQKIFENYDFKLTEEGPGLWNQVSCLLPTAETTGRVIGEKASETYGSSCSNKVVEFVMSKFFAPQPKEWSLWDYFSRIPQKTVTEVAKLTMTPKIVPIMTLMAGASGQVALPLIISLVGRAYHNLVGNASKAEQLAHLKLSDLFTIDPETGRLCGALGDVLTQQDMHDIMAAAAQYQAVEKMIMLCQEIDEKCATIEATPQTIDKEKLKNGQRSLNLLNLSNMKEQKIKEEINGLTQRFMDTCYIRRDDKKLVFPSGVFVTKEHLEEINKAFDVLKTSSLKHAKNTEIFQTAIELIGDNAVYPMQLFGAENLESRTKTRRMAQVFQGEENKWKNHIVQAEDGVCFLAKDCSGRKAGMIVSEEEMEGIVSEMALIQKTTERNQWPELKELFKQQKYSTLADALKDSSNEKVCSFFKAHLIERKDNAFVCLDGHILSQEEESALFENLNLMLIDEDPHTRKEKIVELLKELGAHMPKTTAENFVIKCSDGIYLNVLDDFNIISQEQALQLIESIEIAELPSEQASKRIKIKLRNETNKTDTIFPSHWFS